MPTAVGVALGAFWGESLRIFLSYRREDAAGQAGRISDRLTREFGRDGLFIDVEGIPLGVNFVEKLSQEVANCDVLLAVIGNRWIDLRDEDGNRRLDSPDDFVRIEIRESFKRMIPVIPVLLDGANIPRADQLPDDIKDLAFQNGLHLRHASFHADVDRLIRELRRLASSRISIVGALASSLVACILGYVAAFETNEAAVWMVGKVLTIISPRGDEGILPPNMWTQITIMTWYHVVVAIGVPLAAAFFLRSSEKKWLWLKLSAVVGFTSLSIALLASFKFPTLTINSGLLGMAISSIPIAIVSIGLIVLLRQLRRLVQ